MRPGLKLFFCGLFLALVTLVPAAFGDSFTYTTEGYFLSQVLSPTPATLPLLDSFVPGQIDARLVFRGITSPITVPSGVATSLGSFDFRVLHSGFDLVTSDLFFMNVNFTAPPAIGNFAAFVTGNVFVNAGGATITFQPISQLVTAADGSFFTLRLNVDPVFVGSGTGQSPVNVLATIPEASSLLLLGISGLMLLGMTKMRAAAIG